LALPKPQSPLFAIAPDWQLKVNKCLRSNSHVVEKPPKFGIAPCRRKTTQATFLIEQPPGRSIGSHVEFERRDKIKRMATGLCGSAKRAASRQFSGCAKAKRTNGTVAEEHANKAVNRQLS